MKNTTFDEFFPCIVIKGFTVHKKLFTSTPCNQTVNYSKAVSNSLLNQILGTKLFFGSPNHNDCIYMAIFSKKNLNVHLTMLSFREINLKSLKIRSVLFNSQT